MTAVQETEEMRKPPATDAPAAWWPRSRPEIRGENVPDTFNSLCARGSLKTQRSGVLPMAALENRPFALAPPRRTGYNCARSRRQSRIIMVRGDSREWRIRWMEILRSQWLPTQTLSGRNRLRLAAPGAGHWAAIIEPVEQ